MKVVDFGMTRSARTRTRQKMRQEELNKTSPNLEVEKRRGKTIPIDITPQRTQVEKKKTSPKKVKMASTKKIKNSDKNMPQSPSLKRLQPARTDKIAARTSESSPKPRKSQNAFNTLLQSWENLSTRKNIELDSSSNRTKIGRSNRKPIGLVLQDYRKNDTGV
jgi:hypothetical protein